MATGVKIKIVLAVRLPCMSVATSRLGPVVDPDHEHPVSRQLRHASKERQRHEDRQGERPRAAD